MKFRITFKDPDWMGWNADRDESFDACSLPRGTRPLIESYLEYMEYVVLEFDTDTDEVKVLPA